MFIDVELVIFHHCYYSPPQACIAIAQQAQKEAEEQARKEMEERKRKAEEKKRVKRMLEAGFDGDLDEINAILKEVSNVISVFLQEYLPVVI